MFPDMQYVRITQFMSAPNWFCIIYIAVVFYGCCMDIYLNVELNQWPNAANAKWNRISHIYSRKELNLSKSIIEIKKDQSHNSCKFRLAKWRLRSWITLGSCQFVTWDTFIQCLCSKAIFTGTVFVCFKTIG